MTKFSTILRITKGDHAGGCTLMKGWQEALHSARYWPRLRDNACWLTYTAFAYRKKWGHKL